MTSDRLANGEVTISGNQPHVYLEIEKVIPRVVNESIAHGG